jgi:hypothetical protein
MYEVWVRIDRETRMMRGCMFQRTLEEAHAFAARQWGGRAYEIDFGGETVFVSAESSLILNGNQYSLF